MIKAHLFIHGYSLKKGATKSMFLKQPHIKSVEIKTVEQQDNQAQHKVRELHIRMNADHLFSLFFKAVVA
jgi:hypothetical protein